jgi:hypothetical protein
MKLANGDIAVLINALQFAAAELDVIIDCNLPPPPRSTWEPEDRENYDTWNGQRTLYRALRRRLLDVERKAKKTAKKGGRR